MASMSIYVNRGEFDIDLSDDTTYFGESKEDVKNQLTRLYKRTLDAIDRLEY